MKSRLTRASILNGSVVTFLVPFQASLSARPGTSGMEASYCGVHRPTVSGIAGSQELGCYSIALSGGYEDDVDEGEVFTYTGSGGRDLRGTKNKPKNLRTAPQSSDQVFERNNLALKISHETEKPVRVIRGYKLDSPYAPAEGYRYDGLYKVIKVWRERGSSGYLVCRFKLKRLPNQDPLPVSPVVPKEVKME
ncbi:hypothetical protein DSO57_1024403 [Entomophthora muscae]|uniref:Uncharacterized protein n=1 Tax=Entomophthora muscae TaxID=34485 RepID=A0ACC2T2R9_9FUNG|nr:hypothetical protein DSO57_1024403 [Entomophthora muscae]